MGVVQITLSMSLDGFITCLDADAEQPLGTGSAVLCRGVWTFLGLTPLGRQETWEDSPPRWPQTPLYQWWRRHDEYGEPRSAMGEALARAGRAKARADLRIDTQRG